jgi:peptidoglycan/xylan/chitin deacetylase (PgdA/CDA1 family)
LIVTEFSGGYGGVMQRGSFSRKLSSAHSMAASAFLALLVCLWAPEESRGTYLVFTIDVCWTCGSNFQGTWEGKDYGVPLIAEKLEQYGLKGTFLVSPLCPPDLTDTMLSNLRFLVSRGHDLELHSHPDSVDFSRQDMTMYSIEERRKLLQMAIDNIKRAGAPSPVAHRAGNWSIDLEMLNLLPQLGILMDSSIFPLVHESQVPLPENLANRFVKIGGLYQLPITLIKRVPFIGYAGMTALDLDRTIWEEQEEALKQIADHGLPVVSFYLHFWSLYHGIPSPVPYQPHKVTGPREENILKLDNVLKLVTSDKRFKVVTARELWQLFEERPQELQGPSFIPYTGIRLMYLKAWKDFFGHGIKNKIVAVAPIAFVVGLLTVVAYLTTGRRAKRRL